MAQISTITTSDSISWHVEQSGTDSKPNLVLIPSGEGDCSSFTALITYLSPHFKITTFDTPGFSRSIAPESALSGVTIEKFSSQLVLLLDQLDISVATFYGCSSGGLFALAMQQYHPDRVHSVIIHEVPLGTSPSLLALTQLPPAEIVRICQHIFATSMNEDTNAWNALGPEYHARLEKNYVTWVKYYIGTLAEVKFTEEVLRRRKVSWTVGALTQMGAFFSNVVVGTKAGIEVALLPCKHFPQVSIPEKLAEHIKECMKEEDV